MTHTIRKAANAALFMRASVPAWMAAYLKKSPMAVSHALLACSLLAFSGCSRALVEIPGADATPPITALDVVGTNRKLILMSGGPSKAIELGPADSVVLIALGEDRDGGLKSVSLMGRALVTCVDSAGGERILEAGHFARRRVLPGRPGQTAPGSHSTRYVLRADEFRKYCGSGDLKSVAGAAGVRAVNFHGASTRSPTLAFQIAVPEREGGDGNAPRSAQTPPPTRETRPVHGPKPDPDTPESPRI
jgi:hypothetical protein